MKLYDYSPFSDAYVPYLLSPELQPRKRLSLVWGALHALPLTFMTRWVIYQAFRQRSRP